jgi:hypothetical protein
MVSQIQHWVESGRSCLVLIFKAEARPAGWPDKRPLRVCSCNFYTLLFYMSPSSNSTPTNHRELEQAEEKVVSFHFIYQSVEYQSMSPRSMLLLFREYHDLQLHDTMGTISIN